MDENRYKAIREKYGNCSSWAIWEDGNTVDEPKSNIGDIQVLDPQHNRNLMGMLKPNIIMVGLNISRPLKKDFSNFHDPSTRAMDYKIRYAFKDTKYYGAYMTDIIKFCERKTAKEVMIYLREHPEYEQHNVELFRREIIDLGVIRPTLVVFGVDAQKIVKRNISIDEYDNLIPLRHYSDAISKENYRKLVPEM